VRDLRIKDLVDLVAADVPDAEDRIEKMFDWHHDRSMKMSQWALGASVSLVVALAVVFFRAELRLACWQIGLVVAAAFGAAGYGLFRQWQLRSIHQQFVGALKLYRQLKEMAPFITRYRTGRREVEGE
jgi:hypothetical protein